VVFAYRLAEARTAANFQLTAASPEIGSSPEIYALVGRSANLMDMRIYRNGCVSTFCRIPACFRFACANRIGRLEGVKAAIGRKRPSEGGTHGLAI